MKLIRIVDDETRDILKTIDMGDCSDIVYQMMVEHLKRELPEKCTIVEGEESE